jgi:glycine cleavage system protein P-like pyridoxal-binding family
VGGIPVASWAPQLENCLLVCATEMNGKAQMDEYIRVMREVVG